VRTTRDLAIALRSHPTAPPGAAAAVLTIYESMLPLRLRGAALPLSFFPSGAAL
jgi:hypothetical protein